MKLIKSISIGIVLSFLMAGQAWGANYNLGVEPTVVCDFESATGWNNISSTGTPTVATNSTYYKTGTHSVEFTQSDASASRFLRYRKDITTMNLSGVDGFAMWIYSPVVDTTNVYMKMYLTKDGSYEQCASIMLGTYGAGNTTGKPRIGWNLYTFKKADFAVEGGFDWTVVTQIQMMLYTTSVTHTVYVDSLYINANARAKVVISLDDKLASQVAATQYANSKGIPTTLYIQSAASGISLEGLQALYVAGNDIGPHGDYALTDTERYADSAAILSEITSQYNYVNQYFPRSSKHFAYPNGSYNDSVATEAAKVFLSTGSIQGSTGVPNGYNLENHSLGTANIYGLNRYTLSGQTQAQMLAAVDHAIEHGATLMPYTHTVLETAITDGITIADWEALCDYIKTKVDAGLIDAVTISQWYSGMTATTIAENKTYAAPYAGDVEIWANNLTLTNLTVNGIIWNYGTGNTIQNTIGYKTNNYSGIYSVNAVTGKNNLFPSAASTGPGTYTDTGTVWSGNPNFVDEAGGEFRRTTHNDGTAVTGVHDQSTCTDAGGNSCATSGSITF